MERHLMLIFGELFFLQTVCISIETSKKKKLRSSSNFVPLASIRSAQQGRRACEMMAKMAHKTQNSSAARSSFFLFSVVCWPTLFCWAHQQICLAVLEPSSKSKGEKSCVDWIEEKIKFNVACGSDYSSKVSCCCHSPSCVRWGFEGEKWSFFPAISWRKDAKQGADFKAERHEKSWMEKNLPSTWAVERNEKCQE